MAHCVSVDVKFSDYSYRDINVGLVRSDVSFNFKFVYNLNSKYNLALVFLSSVLL